MSSNKNARERLEKIYGKHCMMHEGLKIQITGYSKKNTKLKGKSIREQLTYHHLIPRRKNGPTTDENGAILCRECHNYLESLEEKEREKINNELRQFKMNYVFMKGIEFSDNGFVDLFNFDFDKEDCIEIPLEKNNARYNRSKAKKELRQLIKEYEDYEL